MEGVSVLSLAEEWVTWSCYEIERHIALEQGAIGRDAGYAQHLNNVFAQQQTTLHSQSSGMSVAQPDGHCEVQAQVKEFDGDDFKFLAECQQDIESDQPEEFRQELKGRVADLHRVYLHAERERCAMALEDQLSATSRDCERIRVQIAHTRVALDEADTRVDSASLPLS